MSHKIVVDRRPTRGPQAAEPPRAAGDVRIDGPHPRGTEAQAAAAPPSSQEPPGEDAARVRPIAIDQAAELRTQARQLAEHLQEQREALSEGEAELQQRLEALAETEAYVRDNTERLSLGFCELDAARSAHEQQVRRDRRAIADEKAREEQELARRRRDLERREREADSREAELKAGRENLREAERELLEMRHACEELWGQIAAVLPPAAIERSIARLRERLTEHYRLAAADVEQRRAELAALLVRLEERHDSLAKKRASILDWATRRQTELAARADKLALREEELAEQEVKGVRNAFLSRRPAGR